MRGGRIGIVGIVALVSACSAAGGGAYGAGGRGDGGGGSVGGGSGGTAALGGAPPGGSSGTAGSLAPGGAGGQGSNPSDYPDVARISMPSTWTANADGSWTYPPYETGPFNALGLEFYANHPDDYDFLVVYTQGELADFGALSWAVQCNFGGIGFDPGQCPFSPSDAGSSGRLLQILIMNAPHWWEYSKSEPDIVIHETTHTWAAFINLGGTPQPYYLLDSAYGGHWNVHVHGGGPSAVGYGDVTDLGGGKFGFEVMYPLRLSPLELYLAGLMPPEEVPPMFYVKDAYGHSPESGFDGPFHQSSYGEDVTFSGTRVNFDVNDVIAANGARTPPAGQAQTHFRYAFVLACNPADACKQSDLEIVEAQRAALPAWLSAATGGRATAESGL